MKVISGIQDQRGYSLRNISIGKRVVTPLVPGSSLDKWQFVMSVSVIKVLSLRSGSVVCVLWCSLALEDAVSPCRGKYQRHEGSYNWPKCAATGLKINLSVF